METFSVKNRCEKFGRIFHMSCIWSNMSQLWIIRSNYFYNREVFDRIYHVPDIFSRMCYMWHTLVNYRCEKLERIFHMWCFRSNVSQMCGELSLFFHSFTAVKYWIEFLTSDIYGRISYMWHILVKYRCEKFGRIFHMWCILLNMWWLWRIWSNCSHLWSVRSYSSCLTYSVGTLHLIFSANVGVRNSVGFFTCDVFCPVCHNLYELDRFFHICAVYHWISHVWYNRSNILHVALSANIVLRNSVGFFTCDEYVIAVTNKV